MLIAERSRVNSSMALEIASGGNKGFNFYSAARSRGTSTTSPGVSRPSVPPGPKTSSMDDVVAQPSSANNPMAGCSTSWSSV